MTVNLKLAIAAAAAVVFAGCTSAGTSVPTSTSPHPAPKPTVKVPTKASAAPVVPAGVVLPDRARTPGATNPAVTQAAIRTTICVTGWTATVRPPSSYTTTLKRNQLVSGYTYKGDLKLGDYEEDHLISLELGGSPTSVLNLWPEPYAAEGAHVKDKIENRLHALVCSGQLTLLKAQRAIATDWWTAYQTYMTFPVTSAPVRTSTPAPVATRATIQADVYYASCAAARAAGTAPLHRGDPGYRSGLDRDGDGVACE